MAITLKKKPELDLNGTRWVHFKLDEEGEHLVPSEMEEGSDLSLLVGSTAAPLFRSHHALIQRHMASIDAQARVGTRDFNPVVLEPVKFDSMDDMLVGLVAKHLIQDWKGVQEEAEKGVPAEYTPERGRILLGQYPELYWLSLKIGTDIALRAEARAEETSGKS